MRLIRLTIPLLLAFLFGMFGIGIQYVPHPWVGEAKDLISLWSVIIGGVAWLLGAYSLTHLHADKIRRKAPGWGYSLFFFLGFGLMAAATLWNGGHGFWKPQVEESLYRWLYDALYISAGATMFSLLGFFIASAAVRTFRARSFEATLLLVAAIVVMLGRVPIGQMLSPYLPRISDWLMEVPNTAAKRGTMLGIVLGSLATSLRIIFGVERSYLGGGD